ncbi:MAG TPA: flippase activity-associated protein Agl23 [Candidatus Saccharimonadales bacterium]|nr:flippase activity-associated protein Agl23 [Candidatus Saccharimonadales bacterium]
MSRSFAAGFFLIVVLALALRLPQLNLRPMHNDEGVNAMKFRALWNDNKYQYDPNEFHGPALPYFTLPAAWLDTPHDFNDFSETTFRRVTAVFGVGLIFLLLLLRRDLGHAETLWASLFLAISPAMVFYSRYYIHEMLLVFFTALAFIAAWRYAGNRKPGWCLLAGAGLGLMFASKETFVFAVLSVVLAVGCARWRGPKLNQRAPWNYQHIMAGLGLAAVVAFLFFSSFLTNLAGPLDAIKTYGPWIHRAGGASPHTHPWNFYFTRLLCYQAKGGPFWTEALIVGLAIAGFGAALAGRASNVLLMRIIAFYTGWMTLIYTVLAYKTPWCLLGFFHGMILLAALGAVTLLRVCKPPWLKGAVAILLAAATVQLGWQAWRGNFATDPGGVPYCDSAKNPYVYSQTTPDILRLIATVQGLANVSPQGYGTVVEVMSPQSYWPLPWYLRRFVHIGFFNEIPAQPLASIMIVSSDLHAAFDERPQKTHLMAGYFELRPNVFFELYVKIGLWSDYVKHLPPEKDDRN